MDHLSRESVSTRLMHRPQHSLRELMQDVVPVFRVSNSDSIFDDYRSKDGDGARIYTIRTEMSNLFGAVRRVCGGRGVEHNGRASGASAESSEGLRYGRTIMTSVDFTMVVTVWPCFRCISRTASAVMIDVIRWPPTETLTWAIRPLTLMSVTRPTS